MLILPPCSMPVSAPRLVSMSARLPSLHNLADLAAWTRDLGHLCIHSEMYFYKYSISNRTMKCYAIVSASLGTDIDWNSDVNWTERIAPMKAAAGRAMMPVLQTLFTRESLAEIADAVKSQLGTGQDFTVTVSMIDNARYWNSLLKGYEITITGNLDGGPNYGDERLAAAHCAIRGYVAKKATHAMKRVAPLDLPTHRLLPITTMERGPMPRPTEEHECAEGGETVQVPAFVRTGFRFFDLTLGVEYNDVAFVVAAAVMTASR